MKISRRIAGLQPSRTLEVTERAARMREEGRDVIALSAGEPDFDTPEPIKEAARRAIAQGRTKYTPAAGLPALRRAIAEKLRRENGAEYSADEILVSCGAKHAIFNAMIAALNEGDEVIIPAPYWVSYPDMVRAAGATPVIVPADPERPGRVPVEAVRARITPRTAMIVANSPHNPTGHVYDGSEWRALAALAVEHDLWLLSDEIYEKLVYEGTHLCPAAISPEVRAHTAVVNGVSKTFAMTGWRIGYLAAPEPLARLAARIQSQSTSCASSISQYAALAALELDRAAVEPMRAEFHRRRDLVLARARECPGLSVVPPAGAFYLWIDVSATGLRPSAFCDRLLEEEAVALVPGEAFGSDRHVRLSFAASGETLERAFERIRRFCERLGP